MKKRLVTLLIFIAFTSITVTSMFAQNKYASTNYTEPMYNMMRPMYNMMVPMHNMMGPMHNMMVPMHNMMGPMQYNILMLSTELGLTKDQKDKIFAIIVTYKEKNDKIETDLMKSKYNLLKEKSDKDKLDIGAIKSINSKIADLKRQLTENRLNEKVDILAILTPDQIKKLKELGWEM